MTAKENKMDEETLNNFKIELAGLLDKYNVMIGMVADDGSDWWGISGEEIVVSPKNSNEAHSLNDGGCWVSSSDLK